MRFSFNAATLIIVAYLSIAIFVSMPTCSAQEAKLLAVDQFDGKFQLDWNLIRENPSHVSLTKNPGQLTISTENGTLGGNEVARGAPSKNLHLIPNPVADDGNFVVTTCLVGFKPTKQWHQAGLLAYDDDDNYLKFDMEFSGTGVEFKHMRELNQFRLVDMGEDVPESDRTWIRITKRGNVYERSYSIDGKKFDAIGESTWGDGSPELIGMIAQHGVTNAGSIDAAFDFFEVRELTDAEKNDARYLERKRFAGDWKVTSCEFKGQPMAKSPFTSFKFAGGTVTFTENDETVDVHFAVLPDEQPKKIVMTALSRTAQGAASGIYWLEQDTLKISLATQPDAPAPAELKSNEDGTNILLTLERIKQK